MMEDLLEKPTIDDLVNAQVNTSMQVAEVMQHEKMHNPHIISEINGANQGRER